MGLLSKLLGKAGVKRSVNQITVITTGGVYENDEGVIRIPLVSSLPLSKQYVLAGTMVVTTLLSSVGMTWWVQSEKAYVSRHLENVSTLQQASQTLSKDLQRVGLGVDSYLKNVFDATQSTGDALSTIRFTSFSDLPELKGKGRAETDSFAKQWDTVASSHLLTLENAYIGTLSLRTKLLSQQKDMKALLAKIEKMSSSAEDRVLLSNLKEAQSRMEKAIAFMSSAESNVSMGSSLQSFVEDLSGAVIALRAVRSATGDASLDDAMKKLNSLGLSMRKMTSMIRPEEFRAAANLASADVSSMSLFIDAAQARLNERMNLSETIQKVAIGYAVLLLLSLGLFALVIIADSKSRTVIVARENRQNQNAIMRLLDEMADLAEGDLTVRTTVSEEITGAIADSVNFAIAQLAGLVEKIEESAGNISVATQRADELAQNLRKITAQQTLDMTAAGRGVIDITTDLETVARRMEASADVVMQAVKASGRGSEMARQTMKGIENIAVNAEETAKRMRRLTESSQQISEIVDLIADISEQTSVLAINATVQATKAGAAGKGFKVVADAVQELANRSAEATRRIGALINATQTDIQAVLAAVEETNVEVKNGEKLSSEAQDALSEIGKISESLSKIVLEANEKMSASARSAVEISSTVQRVLDSVEKSTEATNETSENIAMVHRMSEELRESVLGFKI